MHIVNKDVADTEINELSLEDINDISNNISQKKDSYNLINILIDQYKNNKKIFKFSVPDLSNSVFDDVLDYEFLSLSSKYMSQLNSDIFQKYAEKTTEKNINIYYINVAKMNKFLIENKISSLFNRDAIFKYMQTFLKIKSFVLDDPTFNEEFMSFFEKEIPISEIKEIFEKLILSIEDFNFNFSSIALLMNIFAFNLESSKKSDKEEKNKIFL